MVSELATMSCVYCRSDARFLRVDTKKFPRLEEDEIIEVNIYKCKDKSCKRLNWRFTKFDSNDVSHETSKKIKK